MQGMKRIFISLASTSVNSKHKLTTIQLFLVKIVNTMTHFPMKVSPTQFFQDKK